MTHLLGRAIHVIGGGTVFHVRPHLALSAIAYGTTARRLAEMFRERCDADVQLHLTRMASGGVGPLETNQDVEALVARIVDDPRAKILILNAALCDFTGRVLEEGVATESGKAQPRLRSRDGATSLLLEPAAKLIASVRRTRKDLFLVGFKTTAGASADEQYLAGLELLKTASCNLVLANDLHTRHNVVVAPELARYGEGDRAHALEALVDMTIARSAGSFTATTVAEGALVPWSSPEVPSSLRTVVDGCIARGAYLPFRDVTVGHFGVRIAPDRFLSSRRKRNFNRPGDRDLVRVDVTADGVVAHGAKPSAGARSQFEVLSRHEDLDCIVHFHCPQRPGSRVPLRAQRPFECGSHQCGRNTADGIARFGRIGAVMLDQHGPNIVFPRAVDPAEVLAFIDENFDLSRRTDGAVAAVTTSGGPLSR
jgi:hypothetical protein